MPASPPPPDTGPEWDAIRVPRQLGLAALAILGTRVGAVVEDLQQGAVYYFIPVGTAASWDMENTDAIPEAAAVPIPPRRRTEGPGPHWRMCPGDGNWVTNPDALQAALADAFGPSLGSGKAS